MYLKAKLYCNVGCVVSPSPPRNVAVLDAFLQCLFSSYWASKNWVSKNQATNLNS